MRILRLLVVIGAGLAVAGGVRAADDTAARGAGHEALNKRAHEVLFKVLCDGVDLFNEGKPAAAYYFFQGAVTALGPALDHRPELQKALQEGLDEARPLTRSASQAKVLHAVLMAAWEKTGETLPRPVERVVGGKTLWKRMGGEEGVTKIIDEFVNEALKDKKVNFTRDGKYAMTPEQVKRLKRRFVLLASHLSKGPHQWDGKTMKAIHEGMKITDDEFKALRAHLHWALVHNGVAADDIDFIKVGFDSTRSDVVEVRRKRPAEVARPGEGSLEEALGGEAGMKQIVEDLVDEAVKDKRVNFSRNGKYPMDAKRVAHLKAQFLTLARAIAKSDGSYKGKSMIDAHKGMGITDKEFDAFLEDFEKVLKKNNVKPYIILVLTKLMETKRKDIVEDRRPARRAPGGAASAPERELPQRRPRPPVSGGSLVIIVAGAVAQAGFVGHALVVLVVTSVRAILRAA